MLVRAERHCDVKESFRAAKAMGLYNVIPEMSSTFTIEADIPLEDPDWRVGVVYGPSGSGKSTIAAALLEHDWKEWGKWEGESDWPTDRPIIDVVGEGGSFEEATSALASVGLGTVPTWLRPFHVLSNGERFRAELARLLADPWAGECFIDEYSSVVNRRVAEIGSLAFAKAWRRGPQRRVVFLTPHYDVLPWIQPDWAVRTSLAGVVQVSEDYTEIGPEIDRAAYGGAAFEVRA